MFDTYVTIVGNVLTAPEWRRTTQSNTLVANFKVASTARRLDRESGRWVDGNSLRVRVNCWRRLAEGVAASVMVGDPVVVCGRLYTRDWTDDAGNHRTLYELEAVAVGHDLSRGRSRFQRNRPTMTTSTLEDAEAEQRVHGEATEPVPAGEAPARPDDRPLDDDFEPDFGSYAAGRGLPSDAVDGSLDPFDEPADDPHDHHDLHGGEGDGPEPETDDLPSGDRTPDPARGPADPVEGPPDAEAGQPAAQAGAGASPAGRGRRGRGRVP
ncbi:single-stranded DNA-binding protein, partial [Micromonospora sp. CPCC 205561]|uniref:single-stranded DNA-binding protein n=1 Tax=Micromonospora sp. CPCC 205561 TaxID=3122407 RepID=UPI002FF14563